MWRRYLRFLRSDITADVDEELQFHLEMRARDFEARGLAREEAQRAAQARFGDVGKVAGWLRHHDHTRARAARVRENMYSIVHNLRVGVRGLLRQPTFTAAVLLTLALGIGATTAMFSVVYGVLLRPLPFAEPDRLVRVVTVFKESGGRGAVSAANGRDWKAQSRTLTDVALIHRNRSANLTGGGAPQRLLSARVSASFFPILGVTPLLGRTFRAEENGIGRENVVVLSHTLWMNTFGGDSSIVGRTIPLNGIATEVVGVMRPSFGYPVREVEVWTPLTVPEDEYGFRSAGSYSAIARLKPGVTLEQAQADMDAVSTDLARLYEANRHVEAGLVPLLDDMVGNVKQPLFILLGAVGAMLLIGCANLTNLLLARGVARRRELAVRTALGASRGRLIEQSMTELVPLLAVGGALGVLIARWLLSVLVPLLPSTLPRAESIGLHLPVLGFALAVIVFVALLVAIGPSIVAARRSVASTIGELSRGATSAPSRGRARDLLVVGQIAITLLLLVGATVLARSFVAVRDVQPGFNPSGVLSAQIAIPLTKYQTDESIAAFYAGVLERVGSLPGVAAVGMTNRLPLGGGNQTGGLLIEGVVDEAGSPSVQTRTVSPGYFRALEIPLREGRSFTDADRADAPLVAIIDEKLANRTWPGRSALGQRIRPSGDGPWYTVVGVVGHLRHLRLDEESEPQVYWNFPQRPQDRMALVVKTQAEPASLIGPIGEQVREVDPGQPIHEARPLEEVVERSLAQRWVQTMLLGVFAAIALLLASIGAYGVIAYGVGQRLREFGVRIALGARRRDVVGLVLWQGGFLFVTGASIGLLLSVSAVRVLASLVYGVSPRDALSFVIATLVLFVVSMLACYVPARRAARVAPSISLRSD